MGYYAREVLRFTAVLSTGNMSTATMSATLCINPSTGRPSSAPSKAYQVWSHDELVHWLHHLAHISHKFYEVKNCEMWPRFWTQIAFKLHDWVNFTSSSWDQGVLVAKRSNI